ncbi:MAG: hypothetical protein KF819_12495 [Labilithrix sp.]|nr:hypothetical protein [Labilithrix sp.]
MKAGAALSLVALGVAGACFVAAGCGGDDPPADPALDGGGAGVDGGGPGVDGGGVDAGGGSTCGGSVADPAAAAIVGSYIDKLPNQKPTGAAREAVIDAILRTCFVFAPKVAGFAQNHCWAHLVSAISKESAYDAALVNRDGYGSRMIGGQAANDPTVGYLQVRFSSTVRDFSTRGPLDDMACIGCTIPASFADHASEQGDSAFWAVTGPTANMSLMQSPACNIALGAWYYYVFASGNGDPAKVTYVNPYCAGTGTAGNLVTGLLSHLKGPDGGKGVIPDVAGVGALMGTDANAHRYVTQIKASFDAMVGAVSGTHPFFVTLPPSPTQYCR